MDGVFPITREDLADGEVARLPGFGAFGARCLSTRAGRNPRADEAVALSASRSPTFDAVNGGPTQWLYEDLQSRLEAP